MSDKISHTIGVFCAKYVAYTQTVKHITSCKLKNIHFNLQNVKEKTSVGDQVKMLRIMFVVNDDWVGWRVSLRLEATPPNCDEK